MRLDFYYYNTVMKFVAKLYFKVAEGTRVKNNPLEGLNR